MGWWGCAKRQTFTSPSRVSLSRPPRPLPRTRAATGVIARIASRPRRERSAAPISGADARRGDRGPAVLILSS
eukprot:9480597-Pyramimonas_sp.AAC.2